MGGQSNIQSNGNNFSGQMNAKNSIHRGMIPCGRGKKRRRRAFTTDDPRRSYVESIFGAFNGADSEGILQVLRRICVPDVVFTSRYLGDPKTITTGKLYREIQGQALIAMFLENLLMASPDCVLRLQEKKMRLRQDNSSYIVGKYTLEGHKFCNILTTNDRNTSKRFQIESKGWKAAAANAQANDPHVRKVSRKCTAGNDIHTADEDLQIGAGCQSSSVNNTIIDSVENDWLEDMCLDRSSSPFSFDSDSNHNGSTTSDNSSSSLFNRISSGSSDVEASIAEKTAILLSTSQFKNKDCHLSGSDQKVSIATSTTEFGLGASLATAVSVATIGTMALHINPSLKVYKIDFLWTYAK